MIKIGITGEMGSGKSFCSKIFEQIGVPVFYSDDVARTIINTNSELKEEIKKEFGQVYDNNGIMIPSLIRSIVFVKGSEEKLKRLNELVHPYVFNEYDNFCELNKDKKYTLIESAILYESKLDKSDSLSLLNSIDASLSVISVNFFIYYILVYSTRLFVGEHHHHHC